MNASRAKAHPVRLESAGRDVPCEQGARSDAFAVGWNRTRFHPTAIRASCAIAAAILVAATAAAQALNFDDRATGFLTAQAGGMPPDAWNGTTLGTAKRLVSA